MRIIYIYIYICSLKEISIHYMHHEQTSENGRELCSSAMAMAMMMVTMMAMAHDDDDGHSHPLYASRTSENGRELCSGAMTMAIGIHYMHHEQAKMVGNSALVP